MIRTLTIASALAVSSFAFAADFGTKKPSPVAPVVSAACKETKGLPADAFGFATGSDVADLGAWGVALDTAAFAGGRGGKSSGIAPTLQVSGSFVPCFEVGPYVFMSSSSYKPYGGVNTSGTVFGGGVEMKYKLLGRATHGFGLTLAANPQFGGYNGRLFGSNGSAFNNSFRILADAELVKGKLYGAFNVELFQFTTNNSPALRNSSTFALRAALTTPITDSIYLGAEASYQVAKTGAWVSNRFIANAVYVGPTFFWQINDKLSLNGTWAYQVAGNDKAGPGRKLGTNWFPLNQARVKLGYAF